MLRALRHTKANRVPQRSLPLKMSRTKDTAMPQLIAPTEVESLNNLRCEVCDATMRLYGIELHPTIDCADLRTYLCPRCEEVQTAVVSSWSRLHPTGGALLPGAAFDAETTGLLGSAFDAAWEAAAASDSSLADAQDETSARESLARCIIEIVRQGETNPDRLAEDALNLLKRRS